MACPKAVRQLSSTCFFAPIQLLGPEEPDQAPKLA